MLGSEALSCLCTTSLEVTCSLHIVPQAILMHTFNGPLIWDITSLMSPWIQFHALATSLSRPLVARLQGTDAPVTTEQADREGSAPLHAKPEMELMLLVVPPNTPLTTEMATVEWSNTFHNASSHHSFSITIWWVARLLARCFNVAPGVCTDGDILVPSAYMYLHHTSSLQSQVVPVP